MNPGRAEFLRAVIGKLDASGISWCCLRNHREFFEDTRSDVDLLVLPDDIPLFETFLEEACGETGTRLVQEAAYLNFSRTYFTPAGEWVRIDYEAEIRWWVFPVLPARSILLRRIRADGLWIASPMDEAVVLWIAALFRHSLSDRYRARLTQLDAQVRGSFSGAAAVYQEAFGLFGKRLWESQQDLLRAADLGTLWEDFKVALVLRVFRRLALAGRFLLYLRYDLARAVRRVFQPRGLSFSIQSSSWSQTDSIDFLWRFDRVFPVAKSLLVSETSAAAWGQRLRIARTLFKGGLVLHPTSKAKPNSLPRSVRQIQALDNSEGGWIGAVLPGGWMTQPCQGKGPVEICYRIGAEALKFPAPTKGRRLFCVVLGLDGSGKTTLARHLAQRISQAAPYPAFRYFHFLPTSRGQPEFPWPGQAAMPKRGKALSRTDGFFPSLVRLFRNLIRAWWGIHILYRGFRGVIFGDRYLYNYLMDPASVRYFGSPDLAAKTLLLAPRPDLIFVLETPAEVILQRKQELSPEEIRIQTAGLKNLPLVAGRVVRLDGALPPEILADQCLREIRLELEKN